MLFLFFCFFFQAEDGIRDAQESRGLGDVYKIQGQAFLAFIDDMNYTLINLNTTSMSLDWGYLSGIFDYYSGIELELKYDTNSNQYRIYLNNTYVTSLHSIIQLKDFYICIQENGEGTTLIKDLVITN